MIFGSVYENLYFPFVICHWFKVMCVLGKKGLCPYTWAHQVVGQFLKSSFLSLNLKPLYCLSPNCLFYYVEAKLSAFNPGCKIVRMPNCPTIAHQQYFLLLFKKWAKFDWYRYKWMAPRGRITVICCSQGLIVDTVKAIFLQDLWKIRGNHFYISVS